MIPRVVHIFEPSCHTRCQPCPQASHECEKTLVFEDTTTKPALWDGRSTAIVRHSAWARTPDSRNAGEGAVSFNDVVEHRIHTTDAVLADDDALERWIRQTVGTARHVSGTCKMGPDADPLAVVDQYCRVKGVQGLWVVDASVMPRIPRSGGAHATVVMIGERVVDWIAGGVPVSNG